jgi:hypothetical protein
MCVVMLRMVVIVMMVMARERRHGDHDHHDQKQRQQLFHGRIIARDRRVASDAKVKRTSFINRFWLRFFLVLSVIFAPTFTLPGTRMSH